MAGPIAKPIIHSLTILVRLATSHTQTADGAVIPNGVGLLVELKVTGKISCTVDGNPAPGASGLAGVPVALYAADKLIAETISNTNGAIQFILKDVNTLPSIVGLDHLTVKVNLPSTSGNPSCSLLNHVHGILESVASLDGIPILDDVIAISLDPFHINV